MTISSVIQKPWQRVKSLPMKQKLWALALMVIVVCFLIPRGGGATQGDAKKRIERANKVQNKLCLMKIDAATCAYVTDDAWYGSYGVCYTHRAEIDVIIDLTKATVSKSPSGEITVGVPEPIIDKDTLNLCPDNMNLWKPFGGAFSTQKAKTRCDKIAEDEMLKEVKEIGEDNFWLSDAKRQAVNVLHSMYNALDVDNVIIEFKSN